jgi:hypothetical protein
MVQGAQVDYKDSFGCFAKLECIHEEVPMAAKSGVVLFCVFSLSQDSLFPHALAISHSAVAPYAAHKNFLSLLFSFELPNNATYNISGRILHVSLD